MPNYLGDFTENALRLAASPVDVANLFIGRPMRATLGYLSNTDIPEPPMYSTPYWRDVIRAAKSLPKTLATPIARSMGGVERPQPTQVPVPSGVTQNIPTTLTNLTTPIVPGMSPINIGDIGESDMVKKWRAGKGKLSLSNVGDQFYMGENLPSAGEMNRLRGSASTPSAPSTPPTPSTGNIFMDKYIQSQEDMRLTIPQIIKKGKSLGKDYDNIMNEIKLVGMTRGWFQKPPQTKDYSMDMLKAATAESSNPASKYYKWSIRDIVGEMKKAVGSSSEYFSPEDLAELGGTE